MDILQIINKKKNNEKLTKEELEFAFNGYLNHEIKDYQMSSLLMAICINGMSFEETLFLTGIFINSGKKYDLYKKFNLSVDKHSTGGIGDKVSIIVVPLVASCGIVVPKMSGRGLGITGGTVDKLESIDGFKVEISDDDFIKQLTDIKCAIISQNDSLCPLDKEIYTLRDVSGTTNSIPLIASSIMSKKIALGTKNIVIDLKVGNGALIKNKKDARKLKKTLIDIGKAYDKNVLVVISNMNSPLGNNIGNKLEIMEAIDILLGKKNDLYYKSLQVASNMVCLAKNVSYKKAYKEVLNNLENKNAYNVFLKMIKYQGGIIDNLKINANYFEVKSLCSGILKEINASKIGNIVKNLGGGRINKEDKIDYDVGIILLKKEGEKVLKGDSLCQVYHNRKSVDEATVLDAFVIK